MTDKPDNAQRTEAPTPKRLRDARKKGDAPKSQEVIAAGALAAGALVLWLFAAPAAGAILALGGVFIEHPHAFAVDGPALTELYGAVVTQLGGAVLGIGILFFIGAILANVAQAAPVFTVARMTPSLSKISPIAGAKRIFGPSGLFNFAKGVFKILIVGAILIVALWPDRDLLTGAIGSGAVDLLGILRSISLKLFALAVLAMVVVAGLDYGFQHASWIARLRMTKEEVRRELKETEGDPHIKARRRHMRESRSRRRMIEAVKDATVVIMNPVHFAVALDYDAGGEAAPICVAKGADELALRMRQTAEEHGVPVVENPPLARTLFAAAELDEEIPVEHFEAVAKIIGLILARARQAPPPLH